MQDENSLLRVNSVRLDWITSADTLAIYQQAHCSLRTVCQIPHKECIPYFCSFPQCEIWAHQGRQCRTRTWVPQW